LSLVTRVFHCLAKGGSYKGQAEQGGKDAPIEQAGSQGHQPHNGQDPAAYPLEDQQPDQDQGQTSYDTDDSSGWTSDKPKEPFHLRSPFLIDFCAFGFLGEISPFLLKSDIILYLFSN
jgi:hypothetical protein